MCNYFTTFDCPNGCENGACKRDSASSSSSSALARCGNRIRESGEDCDDGNTQNGDYCTSQCKLCPAFSAPYCPDGTLVGGTELDERGCRTSVICVRSSSSMASETCAKDGQRVYGSTQFGPTMCCSKNAGIMPNAYLAGDQCVATSDGSKGTCIDGWWKSCGDGTCGEKENKCSCPRDCSVCIKEGEKSASTPFDPPCCYGLTSVNPGNAPQADGSCPTELPVGAKLCTNCGNGTCEPWENKCSCPRDCTATTCGNKRIDTDEECDPSAESYAPQCGPNGQCNKDCKCLYFFPQPPPPPPVTTECGNGVLDTVEQCDPSAPDGTVACKSDQKCGRSCKCVSFSTSSAGQSFSTPPAGFEDEVQTNPVETRHNWFSDVSLEDEVGQAANFLADKGVIGGYQDGTFRPEKTVNRAEAAKFLLLARYGSVTSQEGVSPFRDAVAGQWYVPFIIRAAETGIIGGYADGTFRPANMVNTAEFLKMLSITFKLSQNEQHNFSDVSAEDWFAPYVGSAFVYKLFPDRGLSLEPQRLLTRGEVAIAIARILQTR